MSIPNWRAGLARAPGGKNGRYKGAGAGGALDFPTGEFDPSAAADPRALARVQ